MKSPRPAAVIIFRHFFFSLSHYLPCVKWFFCTRFVPQPVCLHRNDILLWFFIKINIFWLSRYFLLTIFGQCKQEQSILIEDNSAIFSRNGRMQQYRPRMLAFISLKNYFNGVNKLFILSIVLSLSLHRFFTLQKYKFIEIYLRRVLRNTLIL